MNNVVEQKDETKSLWRYVPRLRKTPCSENNMIKYTL